MRLKIILFNEKNFEFTIHYNHSLQSLIYNNLSSPFGKRLHQQGFSYEKRTFKLFTFSRLFGDIQIYRETSQIKIGKKIYFYVSSPLKDFIQNLTENLLKKSEIKLGNHPLTIESIEILPKPAIKSPLTIKMLSPVTVRSTLTTPDGKKKSYFYNPKEKEFQKLIKENLKKKYSVLTGEKVKDFPFSIKSSGRTKEVIGKFKGIIVKGYIGKFVLQGDLFFLEIAYDCGIGEKNSGGFGCFEIIEKKA